MYGDAIRGAVGNPATTSFLPITRGFGKDVLGPTFEPQLSTAEALSALQGRNAHHMTRCREVEVEVEVRA